MDIEAKFGALLPGHIALMRTLTIKMNSVGEIV